MKKLLVQTSLTLSSVAQANRTVKQQEKRLQVAWQTRNEAMAATQELRSRIEGLRRERLACSDILKKSESTAKRDQSSLATLLTEAGYAAEQREAVSIT